MRRLKHFLQVTLLLTALFVLVILGPAQLAAQSGLVRIFSINPDNLLKAQREIVNRNKMALACLKRLQNDADKILAIKPVSVMDKESAGPSGDKHDYISYGRYFWPDPSKPDGLPYINRDGESNPEAVEAGDHQNFQLLSKSVHTLGLTYFFTVQEKYAEHAAKFLRTWFLNPETKMNPNLNYAQMVRGRDVGRPSGLIDLRSVALLIDGVGLIAGSKSWTAEDQNALVAWFTEYSNWLQTAEIAVKESQTGNNHSIWFDVQQASIALFIGDMKLARSVLSDVRTKRIAGQIEPDGSQPRELGRTRSMHYVAFNLDAMANLALLAEKVGIDLWNYESLDGRSMRKALDWFFPYYTGELEWTKKQIDPYKREAFYSVLLLASAKYEDKKYIDAGVKAAGERGKTDKVNLMHWNW